MPGYPVKTASGLALLLVLAACALAPHFETPRLSVVGVQLVSSELWEQRLKVRLRVQNPNDQELAVKGIEYTLDIAGQQVASGVSDASFVVPALGEAQFDTNLTTNMAGALLRLVGRGSDTLSNGVDYHLAGRVSLASGWMRSVPFDERGTFRLQ
ncbi:MAG: LEA type 2 family protein [Steroidobacteraceae bacterium]